MPELQLPTARVAPSVRESANGSEVDHLHAYNAGVATLRDDELPGYVADLLAQRFEDTPRPLGWVPATHLWYVDGDTFLGRIHIRHRLSPWLREIGGHIGYFVAPAHRRQGYATAMLLAALPWAADLGLECVMLTCDTDNVASRRVIESCGGLFERERAGKLRFWVPTYRG